MTSSEPVRAIDQWHLRKLIATAMESHGVHCDLNHIDVSGVTDMSRLFKDSPFNGNMSKWDVSNVKSMESMFRTSPFNGDISGWDVSNVQTMEDMFGASYFDGDISNWNTERVTNMGCMFMMAVFKGDLSKWNVSSVCHMYRMFEGAAFSGDLSSWDVSKATDMQQMFQYSRFNGNVSGWQLNPKAQLRQLLTTCPFQGDFPRLDIVHCASSVLVDKSYRGRFNNQYDLYDAEKIFGLGTSQALNSYIRDTASGQLDRLHFEKLLYLKSKPPWIAKDVYQWVKKQQPVLEGLGMESSEAGLWLQENFALKQDAEQSYPLDALQLDVLCP